MRNGDFAMPKTTRRTFVSSSIAAGALLATGGVAAMAQESAQKAAAVVPAPSTAPFTPVKPLRILILGGTGFIGPHQVRYAVSRGHKVTVFNRGRANDRLPAGVEQLEGDRNGKLDALKNRTWDAVIDNPSTLPRWVRDAAQLLKDSAGQYLFISTISVYADDSKLNQDEDAPLQVLKDPTTEDPGNGAYGGLKALAEQEAKKAFGAHTTIVRPGLIVGPGDMTDRFTYWPVRIARGGEVLAPGNPTDPVQFIDARDLAEWTIRLLEQRVFGTFNATGPSSPLTIAEMLYGIRAVTTADVHFTWVPAEFLEAQKVGPWMDMPVWVPSSGETAGFATRSIRRALDKGLTFRPLADTARDTLTWQATRPSAEKEKPHAGITAEREAAVLAAWKQKKA
jgi:2'-hydroxyisoflavone reductase